MGRFLDMSPAIVDELRDIYRKGQSTCAVVRHIRANEFDQVSGTFWGEVVILMEVFHLELKQTAWLTFWDDGPDPSPLTDEELDAKMRPEIESKRHLWDRPASQDDAPRRERQ